MKIDYSKYLEPELNIEQLDKLISDVVNLDTGLIKVIFMTLKIGTLIKLTSMREARWQKEKEVREQLEHQEQSQTDDLEAAI